MRRARGALQLLAWLAGLTAALVLLDRAGQGPMAGPALRHWSAATTTTWLRTHDPIVAAMVAVRLAAIVACWYLVATTVLGAVTRLVRATSVTAILDRLTVTVARRALTAALGTGITFGSLSGGAVAAAAGVPPPGPAAAAPSMHLLTAGTNPSPATPPVMHVLGDARKSGPPTDPAPTPPFPAAADSPPRSAAPVEGPGAGPPTDPVPLPSPSLDPDTEVTLLPGDHLWLVAERTLAAAWRRPPSDREIAPYWRTLVERNRSRLADPRNPDLVYAGQVIRLPAPPSAGGGR